MRNVPPHIVTVLSRAIDEIHDQEKREDDEARAAKYAEVDRRLADQEERKVCAAETTARSLDRLANVLERISMTGIPGAR